MCNTKKQELRHRMGNIALVRWAKNEWRNCLCCTSCWIQRYVFHYYIKRTSFKCIPPVVFDHLFVQQLCVAPTWRDVSMMKPTHCYCAQTAEETNMTKHLLPRFTSFQPVFQGQWEDTKMLRVFSQFIMSMITSYYYNDRLLYFSQQTGLH